MATNTHRDNAAGRVALMEILTEFQANTLLKQFENINNVDIQTAMKTATELKTKFAEMTAGEDPEGTFRSIGSVSYLLAKGLNELSEEDIFTINMIDPNILTNFETLKSHYGVKYE